VDSSGNLYSTTVEGGASNRGTVFSLAPDGAETQLYAFTYGSDGYLPYAGLVEDSTGNLYGTTFSGGSTGCNKGGCGVVFKLAPDGTETVLHAFDKISRGRHPAAGLLLGRNGLLYGTTENGGHENDGVVFRLKK
jgi:uncharacterized repeat protein (TIGR03803 family)